MKKSLYLSIIVLGLLVVGVLGYFFYKEKTEIAYPPILTEDDLTRGGRDSSGENFMMQNNTNYILKFTGKEYNKKNITIDIVSGSMSVQTSVYNNGKQKKLGSSNVSLSTYIQKIITSDRVEKEIPVGEPCVTTTILKDGCGSLDQRNYLMVDDSDEEVIVTIKNTLVYGNPVFSWKIEDK